ncbi:YlmC/YmxH family sporulation protein [Bacillaceae bacterium]
MVKISEMQTKDVVNVLDGRKLGQINDLELDLRHGRIEAIIVPGPGKFFGLFGGGNDIVIPWKNIVKIGKDVVLVRLEEQLFKTPVHNDLETYRPYSSNEK